jgi:hypothetical protein
MLSKPARPTRAHHSRAIAGAAPRLAAFAQAEGDAFGDAEQGNSVD